MTVKLDLTPLKNLRQNTNKLIKDALKPIAIDLRQKMKSAAPVDTGALKKSIGYKLVSKKGSAAIVVGVKSRYKLGNKEPIRYARLQDDKSHYITNILSQSDLEKLTEKIRQEIAKYVRS